MMDIEKKTCDSYTVVKRDGRLVPFRRERIERAIELAFRDTKKINKEQRLPEDIKSLVEMITDLVIEEVIKMASMGASLTVEGIQDIVEIKFMEIGHHEVARDYIVYREEHKKLREDSPRNLKILRRDGVSFVRFNPMKIASAIERGFRDTQKISGITPPDVIEAINNVTDLVVMKAVKVAKDGSLLTVELIQDEIEKQLMVLGYYETAKDYILYRTRRAQERKQKSEDDFSIESEMYSEKFDQDRKEEIFSMTTREGKKGKISRRDIYKRIAFACKEYKDQISIDELVNHSISNFYEGIKEQEIDLANIMATRAKIELEPIYAKVASNLLLDMLYREVLNIDATHSQFAKKHQNYFEEYLKKGIALERINPSLLSFDIDQLSQALDLQRDRQFTYLGLQTLYDRYFLHTENKRLETPQIFWMRIAMGLALHEGEQKNQKAIEFYDVISKFLYVPATPTLFNAGTTHSQLSSCYLSTVMDDLSHIFKTISDDAQLSKWAGGLGNDWSNVRATGALIKGTNGKSQGVIPFLKVANDTAVAVNQGGKRKGAMCSYLETWHLDIEGFLELRKNTGDERRRTHDMNTANWIPDLFMKRVQENGPWTLFSPNDVPDLHDLYGQAFEKRYTEYEHMVDSGKLKLFKRVEALSLWRKMLGMLFETGHPWITFKDASNIRSSQDHAGVVHSSNLCTEILLNTSAEETAVCNLGSINLPAHMTEKGIQSEKLASTIRTAIRMLDNVIDINFYPIPEARTANLRHRAIGLGMMGFQDALYMLNLSYASHDAIEFADESMELISYYAILASSELAKERGPYSSFKGSKWDRGILPIDSIELLEQERGGNLKVDRNMKLDWEPVRESIRKYGMRNCNTMAIAPTATISNIIGITQSIEPMYKHLFVKSNLSGEFTIVNTYLVEKLKKLKLWDTQMLDDLKYYDGSIAEIDRIPHEIKLIYLSAFEIEPDWIIECASRRQKWIDMGQSVNLYIAEPSGRKLHDMYMLAWERGLKTTYYLRAMGATHIEKVTTDINLRENLQPRWMKSKSATSRIKIERETPSCSLGEECESCQ